MMIPIIIISVVVSIIVFIVFFVINKKKNENTARIEELVSISLKKYDKNGVSSVEKLSHEKSWLPKNESVYGRYSGTITFKKYLKSGVKFSTAGSGHIIVSDKAITVESNSLASGKRRFLFKNMNGNFAVVRTINKTDIAILHKNAELIFHLDEEKIKKFALAIHLLRNPIKNSDSISF